METVQLEVPVELAQRLQVHRGQLTQILEWGLHVAETEARKSATALTEGKLPARRKLLEALRSTGLVVELDATLATRYRAAAAQPRRTPVYVQGKPLSEVIIAERGPEWSEDR
jgi:hypothetical protein